jgi:hypothetical protein
VRRVPWLVRYAWLGRRGEFRNFRPEDWVRAVREGRL